MFIRLWKFDESKGPVDGTTFEDIKNLDKISLMNEWLMASERRGFVHTISGNPIEKYTYLDKTYDAITIYEE